MAHARSEKISQDVQENKSHKSISTGETAAPQVVICPTTLIPDKPSTEDFFGGSHDRIAEAIASLITGSSGGKAIGIEGGWGSGKTTIVRLLTEKLKKDENFRVFLFDAWAHEGDPLRRSFLESLLDYFIAEKWLDENEWRDERDILQRRLEKRSTTTVPHFTALGKLVILSLALIPIGSAFVSATSKDITIDPALPLAPKFLVGVAFVLAPALLIGLTLLFILGLKLFGRDSGEPENRKKSDDGEEKVWALFLNKASTERRTETNETPVPTSIEFEKTFTRIMEAALKQPTRRAVLVLDNLDRIEAASALSIWSTLQTFLRPREDEDEKRKWLERLWVSMPYDSEGLYRLWARDNEDEDSIKSSPDAQDAPDRIKPSRRQNIVALSFLDKSFNIRFEVPPPVLSNWHSYLLGLFERAFPEHRASSPDARQAEGHTCYRLYAWYLSEKKQLPNPRGVKLYVNQIGALHRQWNDEYELPHMAYYVLLRRLGYDVIDMLLKGQLPHPEIKNLFRENVAEELAGLAFNIHRDQAKQIILENPINEAIEGRKPEDLVEVKSRHEGFWEALERIAETKWSDRTSTLANAAYALSRSKMLEERGRSEVVSIKYAMRKAALDRKEIWTFSKETAEGLAELVKLNPDARIVLNILGAIGKGMVSKAKNQNKDQATVEKNEAGIQERRQSGIQEWIAALKNFLERLRWRGLVFESHEGSPGLRARNSDEEFIAGPVPDPLSAGEESDAVYGPDLSPLLELLCQPITERLRETDPPINGDELNSLLEALIELEMAVGGSASLSGFAKEGYAMHYLAQGVKEQDYDKIASCLFIELRTTRMELTPSTVTKLAREGIEQARQIFSNFITSSDMKPIKPESVAREFASRVLHFGAPHMLFDVSRKDEFKPFVTACLLEILRSKDAPRFYSPANVLNEWEFLSQNLGNAFYDELPKLITPEWTNEDLYSDFQPEKARLYAAIAKSADPTSGIQFLEWLKEKLEKIQMGEWIAHLKSSGPLIELVQHLIASNTQLSLGREYMHALFEHGKDIIDGRVNAVLLSEALGGWGNMAAPLVTGDKAALLRTLYETATKKNGDIEGLFFETWGHELASVVLTLDRKSLFEDLFIPLVKKRNGIGIRWVTQTLTLQPGLIESLEQSDMGDFFKEEVRELNDPSSGTDAGAAANELASLLGISFAEDLRSNKEVRSLPINKAVYFVFDRLTLLPAEDVTVSHDSTQSLNLTVNTPKGRMRFSNVGSGRNRSEQGTYIRREDVRPEDKIQTVT